MRLDDMDWTAGETESELFGSVCANVFGDATPQALRRLIGLSVAVRVISPYDNVVLARLTPTAADSEPDPIFALIGSEFVQFLSGEAADVYALNRMIAPPLDDGDDAVRDYLSFFLEAGRGSAAWRLVERPDQLTWRWTASRRRHAAVTQCVSPISVESADTGWVCEATLQQEGRLLARRYLVRPDGLVHALSEREITRDRALAAPSRFRPAFSLARALGFADAEAAMHLLTGVHRAPEELSDTAELAPSESEPPSPVPTRPDHSAILRSIAQTLLLAAVFDPAGPTTGPTAADSFFAYLRQYRPTIAIATPFRELREDFCAIIAEACGIPRVLTWQTPQEARPLDPTLEISAVVAVAESFFKPAFEGAAEIDAGTLLSSVIRGPHIGLFVAENVPALPQDVRDMIDLSLRVPRMDAAHFLAVTKSIFPDASSDCCPAEDWMRYALPRDIARAATATDDVGAYLTELRGTVLRRLAQYTAPDAPTLAELNGLGQARFAMEALTADIRAALRGDIGWDQVDRGFLLVGPPGTGKTTLVRALAKECGIRFVLASAGQWQEGGSLGPHIQNIRRTFREARLYAPSILFIDEIDSLGTRGRVEGHNSQYQTVVINTVLEELGGFEHREGVIAIGATNNLPDVDPALRRPGRLDHVIEVPYPNVAALAGIYDYYLRRAREKGFSLGAVDIQRLAQMTFGGTGAHVEVYVRGAIRRARRDHRHEITEADVLAEILDRPLDGLRPTLPPDAMRRVAVHEAGHALFNLTSTLINRPIAMVSITPRADGSLGFVARNADDTLMLTRAQLEEEIRFVLAGRAAEAVVFGPDGISTGAGGQAGSDLEVASRLVMRLLTQFGFSESSGLLWVNWRPGDDARGLTAEAVRNLPLGERLLEEARGMLDHLFASAIARIVEQRPALDAIVALLVERQDVSVEALRGVMTGVERTQEAMHHG